MQDAQANLTVAEEKNRGDFSICFFPELHPHGTLVFPDHLPFLFAYPEFTSWLILTALSTHELLAPPFSLS